MPLKYSSREDELRSMFAAARHIDRSSSFSARAKRYISSGKSVEEIRGLIFREILKNQGPDIQVSERIHRQRLEKMISWEVEEARQIAVASEVIANPKTRKRLLKIIDAGPADADELLLLLEAHGMYNLVCRDVKDNGERPCDMVDYLKSGAWRRWFNKAGRGGPSRKVAAGWLAMRLSWWFSQSGKAQWGRIADIIQQNFPGLLSIPSSTKATKSERSARYRDRRWAKELVRRYCKRSLSIRLRATGPDRS